MVDVVRLDSHRRDRPSKDVSADDIRHCGRMLRLGVIKADSVGRIQIDRSEAKRTNAKREGEYRTDTLRDDGIRERRPSAASALCDVGLQDRRAGGHGVPAWPLAEIELQFIKPCRLRIAGGERLAAHDLSECRHGRTRDRQDVHEHFAEGARRVGSAVQLSQCGNEEISHGMPSISSLRRYSCGRFHGGDLLRFRAGKGCVSPFDAGTVAVMDGFAAVDFEFARQVLQRGIAALYLVAFVSTLNQFRPLLGEHGLLPAPELLEWARVVEARADGCCGPRCSAGCATPTGGWSRCAAAGIVVAAAAGAAASRSSARRGCRCSCFLLLWLGYMSIIEHRADLLLASAGRCCCSRRASSPRSSARTRSRRRPS